ncbi:MAG: hypothetical protein H0Z24_05935 [Thermosipho sp. (in: Bacteria)]|nr:hypothetical protein [Thermosipho sp. (in: thermotogales)]
MAIYEGSRYIGSKTLIDKNGIRYLKSRKPKIKPHKDDYIIQFKAGDRLDLLAKRFYGDSQLQWVILDANPEYFSPLDIEVGDYLVIPNPERIDV